MVVSLLAPVVAPMAGVNLWGWQPDHGHASHSGAMASHAHPWDATSDEARSSEDVAFTAGDLLGAPVLPVTPITQLVLPRSLQTPVGVPPTARWIAPDGAPEPPPPR